MKKMWKLIVLIFVLAFFGWIFLIKNKEKILEQTNFSSVDDLDTLEVETSENSISNTYSWKTYRNEEFGFEVKIPQNWISSETKYTKQEVQNNPDNVAQFSFGTPVSKSGGFLVGVYIQSLKKNSVKQEVDRKQKEYDQAGRLFAVKNVIINGQQMKFICPTVKCNTNEEFLGKSYIFDHDGLFWTIIFGTDPGYNSKEKSTFKNFADSFHLTS